MMQQMARSVIGQEEVVRTLIENGVVVPEERIIDGVAQRYWVATSDGSDFSIPDNLQIYADQQLLSLALSHLLRNSCYASRNTSEPIVISAFLDSPGPGNLN